MPANFPTDLPALDTDIDGNDEIASGHQNAARLEINAIAAKVGKDSSTVATSIDYFLKHGSGAFRTHKHDGTSDDGAKLDWDDIWLDAVHTHGSDAEGGTLDWDLVWADAVHDHSSAAEGGAVPEASITFSATGHEHKGTTDGNLIPTTGIEDSAIISRKLAPTVNSVAMTSDFTSTSTSFADVTGASLTVTPSVTSTLIIYVTSSGANNVAANSIYTRVLIDSTVVRPPLCFSVPGAGYVSNLSGVFVVTGVTAAAHTVKLQAKTTGDTLTIYGTDSDTALGTKIHVLTLAQ